MITAGQLKAQNFLPQYTKASFCHQNDPQHHQGLEISMLQVYFFGMTPHSSINGFIYDTNYQFNIKKNQCYNNTDEFKKKN